MIPADSKYCDLCGVELLECLNCGALGTDTFCANCGRPMVARNTDRKKTDDTPKGKTPTTDTKPGDDGHSTAGGARKKLVLKSRRGGISLVPQDQAIIGRGEGPYVDQLDACNLISRRHGQFMKRGRSWYILDFGSTNGTLVNDTELDPDTPVKFGAGDVIDIGTYIFDVVEE